MYISKILRRFYKVDNSTYINLKKVLYVRKDNNSLQIKFEKEDEILITNYCFHTNYINRKNLSLMKKNAILINTSRGKIINEKDLEQFLKTNKYFQAGLDVIDGEWLTAKKLSKHKLIKHSRNNNNLLIVPHIGGSTEESIYGARIFMIKKLLKINLGNN